jgi:hypothetical protein
MAWRKHFCPHCRQAVNLPLLKYGEVRVGWLACPHCHKMMRFPLYVRLAGVFAGLVVGAVAMATLKRYGFYSTSSDLSVILFKAGGFIAAVGLMVLTWALVVRAMLIRFEK